MIHAHFSSAIAAPRGAEYSACMDPRRSDAVATALARIDESIRPDFLSQDAVRARRVRPRLDARRRARAERDRVPAHDRRGLAPPRASATHEGVAVVPSGGRTGLAGGAVAANGEIVALALAHAPHGRGRSRSARTVRVQAGAVTEAVHQHCAPHGLTWPVDFASKGSSQVGGNIATNAGGVKVIRYGLTRQWVLGLEVVLASRRGARAQRRAREEQHRRSICASSSSAARARSASSPRRRSSSRACPGKLDVMLFARRRRRRACCASSARRAQGPFTITAYEFFTAAVPRPRAARTASCAPPFAEPCAYYVLLEVERRREPRRAREARAVDRRRLRARASRRTARSRSTAAQARELWALREGISESLSATGLPHKNDIALPIAALEAFCARARRASSRSATRAGRSASSATSATATSTST